MGHPAPCRRERHGYGRSRVLAPLPVAPGGLHCVTWSQQRRPIGLCDYSWLVFKRPASFPSRSKSDGRRRPPGSAGVPPACTAVAFRSVSLRWGTRPPLPAGTAWVRQKQSLGAVAGRAGWRRRAKLCQDVCGRDARAPGCSSKPRMRRPHLAVGVSPWKAWPEASRVGGGTNESGPSQ